MSTKLAQMEALASQGGKDERHRSMQLTNRELVHSSIDAVGLYSRDRRQYGWVDQTISSLMADDGELDDMFPTDRGDQLLRTSKRNDSPMIHNRHPVAQALSLIHVVRGKDDGSARLLEPVHQVP